MPKAASREDVMNRRFSDAPQFWQRVLARKREFEAFFAQRWKRLVGPVQLAFTRTPEGCKLLEIVLLAILAGQVTAILMHISFSRRKFRMSPLSVRIRSRTSGGSRSLFW